jgi:hypothetical protein
VPHVLRFDWTPPANTSDHVCLLALLDSPDEPLAGETELNVDVLTPHNKRVTHKNVHPVNVVPLLDRLVGWPSLRFHNAFATGRSFDFRLQTLSDRNWTVAMVLPQDLDLEQPLSESLRGLRPLSVHAEQREAWLAAARRTGAVSAPLLAWREWFKDPLILVVENLERPSELRGVRIEPGRSVPAVFVVIRPPTAPGPRLRLDALQFVGQKLVGGSTFLIVGV